MDTFFDIEAQERSRVTKLVAQTQHRVVLRLVPPSASKQSEIMCARDKCVVFHNIGKAISGSTAKNGWKLSKQESVGSNRSLLAKNEWKWVLANQIGPTTHSAALVIRYTRFWPKKHRELPFWPLPFLNCITF